MITIEFNLTTEKIVLRTPYSHREFSESEIGAGKLVHLLRNIALWELDRAARIPNGIESGRHTSDAVLAYDLDSVKRFSERGKPMVDLSNLEIEL